MSPWNYPLLLTLDPPDRCPGRRKHCGGQAQRILPRHQPGHRPAPGGVLSPEHVSVVTGGRQENACLLGQKFDYIFFTGSQAVGREVLLPRRSVPHAGHPGAGRKEPLHRGRDCGSEADRPAHRLWKIPQLRPDLRGPRLSPLPGECQGRPAGGDRPADHCPVRPRPLDSPSYGKIVNQKHFQRLLGLIQPEKVVCGGTWQEEALRIAPTVMDAVTWEDPVMGRRSSAPSSPSSPSPTSRRCWSC